MDRDAFLAGLAAGSALNTKSAGDLLGLSTLWDALKTGGSLAMSAAGAGLGAAGVGGYLLGDYIKSMRTPSDVDLGIMESRILADKYGDETDSLERYRKKTKKRLGEDPGGPVRY